MDIRTKHYDFRMMSMPYAQAHVRFYVDEFSRLEQVEFYSNSTLVLSMDCNNWDKPQDDFIHVFCSVDYSRSTARQVNRFTTELTGESLYFQLKNGAVEVSGLWFKCTELWDKYAMTGKLLHS